MPLPPKPPPVTTKAVARGRGFTIHLHGLDNAFKTLKKRKERLADLQAPLEAIAQDFYEEERSWLNSEGGGTWAPLSPRYAAYKLKKYGPLPILQRSKALYKTFTGEGRPYKINNARLTIDAGKVPYWHVHDQGAPRRNLPKRQVISPKLQQRIQQWHRNVTEWLAGREINRGRTRRS